MPTIEQEAISHHALRVMVAAMQARARCDELIASARRVGEGGVWEHADLCLSIAEPGLRGAVNMLGEVTNTVDCMCCLMAALSDKDNEEVL